MTSILDNAIMVGVEATYGTPATLTRAYEAKADTWKREQEALESVGFRANQHTMRSDRRCQINMGATGAIELDALSSGLGLLLQGALGSAVAPVQIGATTAYTSVFATTSDASAVSYTIQKLISRNDGTLTPFTYHGAVVTDFSVTQDVGGLCVISFSFDAEDEDIVTGAGTPTYPSAGCPFSWADAAITVGGVAMEASSFAFNASMGLKTDRRFLRSSALKKQPKRASVPEYSGEISAEFTDLTQYNAYVAGTLFPVTATWTGEEIEAGNFNTFSITMPACQYDGTTPEAALEDMTTQALPFKVLYNGTDAAVTMSYTSADTAF